MANFLWYHALPNVHHCDPSPLNFFVKLFLLSFVKLVRIRIKSTMIDLLFFVFFHRPTETVIPICPPACGQNLYSGGAADQGTALTRFLRALGVSSAAVALARAVCPV
jgi:hypothetical protein